MDGRAERVGRNEALFRQLNEGRDRLAQSRESQIIEIVCECGSLDCREHFPVTRNAYRRVRQNPRCFFVLPRHVAADVEDIVEIGNRYVVVAKKPGEPTEIAVATAVRQPSSGR